MGNERYRMGGGLGKENGIVSARESKAAFEAGQTHTFRGFGWCDIF